jgi:hypothetical protein
MEEDISGVLTFDQMTHIGARKWVSQSGLAMQIDGHTFRVRAGDGFPGCYPDWAKLIFSFMTACTASATYDSS